MTVLRFAMVTLLLMPALAFGQTKVDKDKENKVSNDDPARPLQMPPASTEVKEAIEDFDRFQRRGAWERALKALYTIPDDQAVRFIDGENGFIIPIERKRRTILSALAPNGQAAARLFYDSEAKKLLDEADGPSELKNLERIFSAYFITSVGDNAADRLGDLYFEPGRFDRAADCWLAILRERPDTDLSPALISVKAAVALSRAGRHSEFEQVRGELANRYSDEKITLGGQTAPAGEFLKRLIGEEIATSETGKSGSTSTETGPDLNGPIDANWQMRFADSIEAGMTPQELTQWENTTLSVVVPAVTTDGSNLYANYLGYIFALDLKSGKLLWRSGSFHDLDMLAMQQQTRFIDATRFAILASGDYLWCLGRDLKDQNFFAPFQLTCRRAENGEIVWKSGDLADYALFDLVGHPILANGKLYITGKSGANPQMPQQGLPQQVVLAVQPQDGKLLWKTEVGSFRQQQQFMFYGYGNTSSPQPRLMYQAGRIYVDTNIGVLGRLDADTGVLDWGYGYQTEPFQGQSRWFYYYQPQEPMPASGPPLAVRRNIPHQGNSVGEALRHRAESDESPLGAADHQGVAVARGHRPDRVLRRGRDQRDGPRDAEAHLGHAPAERQHGLSGAGQTRWALAGDFPGHLRDRSQVGAGPEDLPGQGSGRRGRRSPPDRSVAPLHLQSRDLSLSTPGCRGGRLGPKRHFDHVFDDEER